MAPDPIDRQFRSYLETTYSPIPRDDQEKILDNIGYLIDLSRDKKHSMNELLEQLAKLIFRMFGFGEVAIGLKTREDGFFRYVMFFGMRKDVERNFRRLKYTEQEMTSNDAFPHIWLGKAICLNPVEGLPKDEEPYFNRPYSLKGKRASHDEFREGDYIDAFMYGPGKEIVGWIEVSAPKDGKMPPRGTVRWLELIAGVASLIVTQKWAEEGPIRK